MLCCRVLAKRLIGTLSAIPHLILIYPLNDQPNYLFVILEEGKTEVKRNEDVYKTRKGMLVVHQRNQNEELDFWRMIIPDDNAVKNFVITELHDIPYSLHPGIQRTIQKVRRHFFWKGMTGNIRGFVESCLVCQTEKTDHTLSRECYNPQQFQKRNGLKSR